MNEAWYDERAMGNNLQPKGFRLNGLESAVEGVPVINNQSGSLRYARSVAVNLAALLLYLATACGGQSTVVPIIPTPSPTAARTINTPTQRPEQTLESTIAEIVPTPMPTETPTPEHTATPTPYPTETLKPTDTPLPTATPLPTNIPTPLPTPTPEPTPTPITSSFIFSNNPTGYENGKVFLDAFHDDTTSLGTLVAELYVPNNPKIAFPLQEHEFAAGEYNRFNFDVSQLQRGIDYNLRLDVVNKSTGKRETFNVPGFYIPRAAALELFTEQALPYDRDGKRLTVPVKNPNPDQRDETATGRVELFYGEKPIGSGTIDALGPGSITDMVVGITNPDLLKGGLSELTAKFYDGSGVKISPEKTFTVDVPYLPANLAFAEVGGSGNGIVVSLGQDKNLYTFKVNLTNIGEVISDGTMVEFYRDTIDPSNLLASVPVPNIEPGNPHEVEGTFEINATGEHKIYAAVPKYGITLETTVTTLPKLVQDYQERLVNAGYPTDLIRSITPWQDNEINRGFLDEILFLTDKGYDKQKIVEMAQAFLPEGITEDELKRFRDPDNDHMRNQFEINYNKTDPFTPNERYAVLMNTWEDGRLYSIKVSGIPDAIGNPDAGVRDLKRFLVEGYDWKPENITVLEFKDATYNNFASAIEAVARKATENDDVYILWTAHGGPGKMAFQCSWLAGGLQVCDEKTYEEIDSLVDKIEKARVVALFHDASYSWTMLDPFAEGPTPRLISTNGCVCKRSPDGKALEPNGGFAGILSFYSSMDHLLFLESGMHNFIFLDVGSDFLPKYLKNLDIRTLSLHQFLQVGDYFKGTVDYDSNNLANKLYLGELKPIGYNQFYGRE